MSFPGIVESTTNYSLITLSLRYSDLIENDYGTNSKARGALKHINKRFLRCKFV